MSSFFLDSSAIVKQYVLEEGTSWVQQLFADEDHTLFISRIAAAEVVAAFYLRLRVGTLGQIRAAQATTEFQRDLLQLFQIVDVTEFIIAAAMRLIEQHTLRGYDAVQLATAQFVQSNLHDIGETEPIFVGADRRLNKVAMQCGFDVINPSKIGEDGQ